MAGEIGHSHAYIFDAHLLMLDNPLLVEKAGGEVVRADRVDAGVGPASRWSARLRELFEELSDEYLREGSKTTSTT